MENSLVTKVSQIESLFENREYDNSPMIRNHIEEILNDAGYKKSTICKDAYHKMSGNSVEFFGFNYKQKNQLYQVSFDDFEQGTDFIDSLANVNSYNRNSEILIPFFSAFAGAIFGYILQQTTNYSENPAGLMFASGLVFAFMSSVMVKAVSETYEERIKKLDDIPKEITFGFDAVKSAVGGYLDE